MYERLELQKWLIKANRLPSTYVVNRVPLMVLKHDDSSSLCSVFLTILLYGSGRGPKETTKWNKCFNT